MTLSERLTAAIVALGISTFPIAAFSASFADIPSNSPIIPAAEYLKSKGIIQDSSTFRPNDLLNRAQAAKVLVAPLVSPEELAKITTSTFTDVPDGQWYTSYVEAARTLGLVDTVPQFNPTAPVTKAAFMKMLFKAKNLDYTRAFSDLTTPLSSDVASNAEWYYPIIRFGLATSMTAVSTDGLLSPASNISRGSMALLYYRLDMYQTGRRTQALLSQAETDIGNVLQMLDKKDLEQAQWASARSIIAARGALAAKPDETIVKGAVKISEGFQSLVLGYQAGAEGRLDDAISAAKTAYSLAEKAKGFHPNLVTIATQMQTIAKNMADEARKLKAQPTAQ